ncbi:MAG: NAD(P)H-dependent oxidoreductase [Actinomycetia bacterium]|nr:NAD(P)H-dependent oxidoreductase [Actinomycetes bacterium]
MTEPLNVLGIAGSLRRASVNRGLLRAAVAEAPPSVRLSVFDLAPIPLYNGDVEAEGDPPSVAQLKRRILSSDALLLATPEYNRGMTGVMKNALDWASRPPEQALAGKPVAIVGATPGGFGTRASQFQARQILGNPGACVLPKPEVWVSNANDKFDEHGGLTDQATRGSLVDLLLALEAFARRLL